MSATFWSTGITIAWHRSGRVSASAVFQLTDPGGTEARGEIYSPEVALSLEDLIVKFRADVAARGIEFRVAPGLPPRLYAECDGEGDPAEHYYPPDWREQLAAEANRIGWTGPRIGGIES